MITVTDIKRVKTELGAELQGIVTSDVLDLKNFKLWFRYPHEYYEYLSKDASPYVAAMLKPAMHSKETLKIDGYASKKMLRGARTFMDIASQWWPELEPIEIEISGHIKNNNNKEGVGEFFSGGIDSSYTLLKNEDSSLPDTEKISHLIFVHGFDIKLNDSKLYSMALKGIQPVADEYRKKVIPAATNIRTISDKVMEWDTYCGVAMASIALGLQELFYKIYVPADFTYNQLFPWGSHPLTNPLWGTESMDIVHDGSEANRIEKVIRHISNSQVVLDNLRVCWENRDGRYNCGECEKCIRTMLNLKAAGVLEKCKTFDHKLDYNAVRNLPIENKHIQEYAKQNLDALRTAGCDPKLTKALERAMSPWYPYRIRRMLRTLRRPSRIFKKKKSKR
jgi:hypothetical protein